MIMKKYVKKKKTNHKHSIKNAKKNNKSWLY